MCPTARLGNSKCPDLKLLHPTATRTIAVMDNNTVLFIFPQLYHLEEAHLFICQLTPAAAREVFLGEACEDDTVEFVDLIAEGLKQASHDAVAMVPPLAAY